MKGGAFWQFCPNLPNFYDVNALSSRPQSSLPNTNETVYEIAKGIQ